MLILERLADEELAAMCHGGSRPAEEVLCGRFWAKASIIARSFKIPGVEQDDKESECLAALVKACRTYQSGKGTKFRTYAKMLMIRALIEINRDVNAAGAIPVRKLVSLSQPLDGDEGMTLSEVVPSGFDMQDSVMERLSQQAVVRKLDVAQMEMLTDAVNGGSAADGRLIKAVREFAHSVLPPELFANLVELLQADDDQPKLFSIGPERGSEDSALFAESIYAAFTDVQWLVLCDVADGLCQAEIAQKRSISPSVVSLMTGAAREAASS